jgi:hypothetical protein
MRSLIARPRLEHQGKVFVVARRSDLGFEEQALALSRHDAEVAFDQAGRSPWLEGQRQRRFLEEAAALLGPQLMAEPRRLALDRLAETIRQHLHLGTLLLIEAGLLPPPAWMAQALTEKQQEPPLDFGLESKALSWLAVELVNAAEEPLAGVRVRVTDPEGNVREVTTDGSGRFRLERVPEGECRIELPSLHAAECRLSAA